MNEFISYFFSFQFSTNGAHGSVIVFSDRINEKVQYTKVTIKLNNNLSGFEFGEAINETPYFGFRTRIDLAFELADKVVFTAENGTSFLQAIEKDNI